MATRLSAPPKPDSAGRLRLGWAAVGVGLVAAGAAAWLIRSGRTAEEEPPTAPPGSVPPEVLEEIRQLEEAIQRLEAALDEAQRTAEEIAGVIEEQEQTITELEQVVSELRRKVAEAEALLREILANVDKALEQNKALEELARQLEAEYGEKDARFRQLVDLVEEQRATIETLRAQVEELQATIQELSAEVDRLEALVEELRQQNQELQALITELQAQLEAAMAEIDALNQIIAQLRYELEPVEHTLTVKLNWGQDRSDWRNFYVPYRQDVSVYHYVHAQIKCWLWPLPPGCAGGIGVAGLYTGSGQLIKEWKADGWCSNCYDTKTEIFTLEKGIYTLYAGTVPRGRAEIRATFKAPRFLGRTADPDVCHGC